MHFRDDRPPVDPCYVEGSCRYLRELSQLEDLIGCGHSARFHEATAARCVRAGCWALLLRLNKTAVVGARHHPRFPLRASRAPRGTGTMRAKGATAEIISFRRSDVADSIADDEGNFVERRVLKLGSLDPREPLGYLYDYWRWLRAITRCQLSDIDTAYLMRARIIGRLHVVDVGSADPENFRFDLSGYGVPLEPCEKPRAFSTAIYADSLMRDYNTARLTAAPRFQRVRARLGVLGSHYTRLILPLFDARQRVSRLLVAVRLEQGDGIRARSQR